MFLIVILSKAKNLVLQWHLRSFAALRMTATVEE
jgi:hypothetical protein